ncbi:hypothetical protein F5Y00DRAFT_246291 [Daldinia vernicosa]|uniref:uncharacterized protein n=1 Tax=Daldinia vernicosa TaxID=114800 RepID=UPI0020083CE5|nr:uncharacterized protein F5Y00DRAFT_246291 [Daldinia vernicosa]KAI0845468.1 hypothetical protein F5Y00DRAFT_246291 [Daldinia vernicosa]
MSAWSTLFGGKWLLAAYLPKSSRLAKLKSVLYKLLIKFAYEHVGMFEALCIGRVIDCVYRQVVVVKYVYEMQ